MEVEKEEDINPWRIENLTSIYKSNFRLNWKLLLFMIHKSILMIYVVIIHKNFEVWEIEKSG